MAFSTGEALKMAGQESVILPAAVVLDAVLFSLGFDTAGIVLAAGIGSYGLGRGTGLI